MTPADTLPYPGTLTDVAGLAVGHAAMAGRPTGCTVVLCPEGAAAGVAQRGGAPGTRETDLLRPENAVAVVHGLLLTGGSAFGLDAASGVVRWLARQGHGLAVGPARVPIVPAAVLFATVFSIGTFTRYSEITAAKASGISFYRFIAPILVMATVAMGIDLVFAEIAPPANAQRLKLLAGKGQDRDNNRYNFAFASETGRVYRIYTLDVKQRFVENMEIEERGSAQQPGLLVAAKSATWSTARGWVLKSGIVRFVPNDSTDRAVAFDSLVDRQFTEKPQELQATERQPTEMNFADLSRFITALERSGADVNLLRVERMLKLAIPVTCLIIALFGAPLATSSQRGGAAYGIAVSLATTILFLVLIQLTKAIGGKGLMPPDIAAWVPNLACGLFALVLLARVRT